MTPAEKMDEIVDAMEALNPYVEFGDYKDERDYNDAVERFKAALTLARELRDGAVERWRPWYTCPTDGRAILARFDDLYCETVCKTEHGWYWYEDGDTSGSRTPTHWMPVPTITDPTP